MGGNDRLWEAERAKYQPGSMQDGGKNRYRDWDNLQYWFRGVEKFAPWVRKIHFETCGQCPKWLNKNHTKLHLVDHKDFIPAKYLPTFNSRTIAFHLHKIPGISDRFVYFNDDMFLTNHVRKEDFFRGGMPCDMFSERPIRASGRNEMFGHTLLNNMELMSLYYKRPEFLKKNIWKVLNPKYGATFFLNLIFYVMPFQEFFGIYIHHLPMGYLKSAFEELWSLEENVLTETVSHRFRTISDVNQFIFRFWPLLKGEFYPVNMDRMGKVCNMGKDNSKMYRIIENQKYKTICINDTCTEEEFSETKEQILRCFSKILPEASEFEQ